MAKEQIKEQITQREGNICQISNQPLPKIYALYDTHRWNPKAIGGTYTEGNTAIADPLAHMAHHGNLRERSQEIAELKAMIDDRNQIMKLTTKMSNQLLAYQRGTDHPREETVNYLQEMLNSAKKQLAAQDRKLTKYIKGMEDPLAQAAMAVRSIGPITVAYCLSYIDLTKARHASSLWSYVGLDKPSHSRYTKGEASGGNKRLRTVLFTMAESQVKGNGPYREVYDNAKARREQSDALVWTRNTKGQLVQLPWKDTKPSHKHGDALRKVMKHFLADYWMVGRTLYGLPTSPLYPEAVLGGTHRTIMPEERGWVY